jgi:uncharacterized protein YjbI with pentapeptide repeats
MRVHKPDNAEVVLRSYVDLAGRRVLAVGIVSSFALHPDAALGPPEQSEVWPLVTAAIGDAAPLDEGWAKSRSEFLVYGSAYMPKSGEQQPVSVRARVGDLQKQLAVYGDRTMSVLGLASTPAPFWKMPIARETAFGGPDHEANPQGKGFVIQPDEQSNWAMPNIEHPRQLLLSRADRPEPAGFWALSAEDPRRMRHFGTVDEHWLKTRWPHLPLDTDLDYFQAAPVDQQASAHWRGDEPFTLVNLHPFHDLIQGNLPGLVARILAGRRSDEGLILTESRSVAETVWFFPDHLKGLILHRAVFEVDEVDGDDIVELYAEFSPISSPREPLDAVELRMLAAIAALEQSDLVQDLETDSVLTDNPLTDHDLTDSLPTTEGLHDLDTALGKLDVLDEWQQVPASTDLSIPSSSLVPPMTPMLDPTSAAELAALKSMIEQSKQTIATAFKNTDLTEKDLLEILFNQPDAPGMPDVFSKAPNGITGVLDDLQADIEKLFMSDAQINAALEQEALEPPAAAEVPEEQAQVPATDTQLRQTVLDMHAQGEAFDGMDLTGTDLSGLDLSGADFAGATLAEANFANARLERCCFDGAVLSGAVFTGALLRLASLKDVTAGETNFEQANLDSAVLFRGDFSGANFSGASLVAATLRGSVFSGANMAGMNATDAVADEAVFDEATLDGANFSSSRLKSAQFSNATLTHANLSKCIGPRLDLSGAKLAGANLTGASLDGSTADASSDFSKAILRESVLTNCTWHGANLEGADLSESSLDEADFMGANLRQASMVRAVARGACLDKADLTGFQASGANFFEAGFRGAKLKATSLMDANLFAADFSDAVIDTVRLDGANIDRTIIKLRDSMA